MVEGDILGAVSSLQVVSKTMAIIWHPDMAQHLEYLDVQISAVFYIEPQAT